MEFIKKLIKGVIITVACIATLIAMTIGAAIKTIGFIVGVASHVTHKPVTHNPKGTKEA